MAKAYDCMPTTGDADSSRCLDNLLNRLREHGQRVAEGEVNWHEVLAKSEQAVDLCAAYPCLNGNVVRLSMLLLPLVKKAPFFASLQVVDEVLRDMGPEEKLLILKVLAESQTDFAQGEASVVRYFMNS
ncbi:hypothetical protein [Desulforamulus hydrothermalis]|uniref:Uncharacterized protein n=1 Tax=Desulforamulus hydrothermalis Lam5 = DSM 18033 TaxID=1121428 RepID=K8ECP0_9FIRM|nr:hypothetical protein [Desulforamulus hydrothermalis]CCO09463.1 hypothetical protein DESHY_80130 [Desulforamulus hydrothermalis Lam5 = DSM 18033]SHH07665.1 hypothetical protein SAMN02745177_01344 [Desulforamulus hydrothermalis Lam5 = DSM 18033]